MPKILLVDDERSLNAILTKGLEHGGFQVISAHSGNEALEILGNASFAVDLMISDLYMDEGGGQQLIKWAKENRSELKILAISGQDDDSFMSALDLIECEGVPTMEKPFAINQLIEVVNGMLNSNLS